MRHIPVNINSWQWLLIGHLTIKLPLIGQRLFKLWARVKTSITPRIMTHNASSATRPLLAPGWPIRSQLWAELTNQRLRLCPTLHPAGQWLSGYLCRLYYLYQLWWITWGCSLIVQWFAFQEKQIKKSLGNISSSLKPCSHSDERTLWWRSHSWIHPPCTRGSQANYR